MPFIRSISGIRATINDSLDKETIQQYIRAFAEYLPYGSVVVGLDGRPSGAWIAEIVTHTLAACGRDVLYIGIAPTPTVQLITEHTGDCAGGISISASHNPIEWNGLKFIGSDGVFLDAHQNFDFWKFLESPSKSQELHLGKITTVENVTQHHIESITQNPLFIQTRNITKEKALKVIVDAVNASGSLFIPALLREFGCDVIELYCDNTGNFPHIPEPLPENLQDLQKAVVEYKADLGIAVDPDADRLVLIDENGNAIGEERTITLCVLAALCLTPNLENQENSVVVNLSTTMAVDAVCKKYNANLFRSPVGEINVVRLMQATKAIIGGEGSGGVILPASHYGRDSLVGTALLLSLLAYQGKSLSELNATIPTYCMKKTKVEFNSDFATIKQRLLSLFLPNNFREDDGLYCEFENAWLHVRTSNTEPIARIIAESHSEEYTNALMEKALSVFG